MFKLKIVLLLKLKIRVRLILSKTSQRVTGLIIKAELLFERTLNISNQNLINRD